MDAETKRQRRAEYNRRYNERHPERRKKALAEYNNRPEVKAKRKEWVANNLDAYKASKRKYYEQNKEKICEQAKQFARENPVWKAAQCAKRRAVKLKALPSWASSEDDKFFIEEFHDLARRRKALTGFPWHVDHIVPLQGKSVCGLHVWWNMQVIPGSLNSIKGNRYED